ncbi:hypothetical protein QQZ08_009296 [Neonectria magnoliae]|uniref:Uncharacterized protein n=1 Tax=Neonectria magnoliae TaxID=2732573 RepID=A0ABR1HNW9_9HYPO
MNRFRGRKKTKDDLSAGAASPRPSVESESSGPFKMFGKNKKAPEEEPKPELDLASALPASDDFRTSLLMTGLSARFSMLREQDDPNTKVGKASDDSVLYPKRQSRLMDFGFGGGLSDIAEVESIRAPFARDSSYQSDDAASTSGSMMGRSKPIEGNNLFGGRQKIYKIAANGNKGGATAGRALYDDDVSQSSFQKWRQAERERQSLEEHRQAESPELEHPRPESPPQSEYNRRRETSSTTSSVPSAARNSTAATSTTSSQPTASVKDWQSATAAANPTAPIERTVTRTRRLYEQGLNQDLHNQQTSSLSRIDTLSRQRNFGSRTPDLTPTVPSPASATFSERFANTRSIHNKSSAPNLRSFSPPATMSSQTSPVDAHSKFPPLKERASFGATPPLSPPISETGEPQTISAQFSDRNKSAATSGLNKSSQYDDSRYAQRQMQLQQGRETPTNFFRPESNVSVPSTRSRSSSTHRAPLEKHDSSFKTKPVVEEEPQTSTFFDDDDDDEPSLTITTRPDVLPTPPQLTVERPADNEHPAFRKSALPTPLIFETKLDDSKNEESPEDSPTLGPTSGGLSGMVRAHLRQDSNASSNYGSAQNDSDLASRFPPERSDIQSFQSMKSNPWESIERGVEMSMDSDLPSPTRSKSSMDPQERGSQAAASAHDPKAGLDQEKDTDDFARHLADGARRVRERLTSYVESDSGSSAPAPPPISELPPPPRPNALGILKAKSSRGSLVDRTRGDQSQTKTKKLLGLGGPGSTAGAYTSRPGSFEVDEQNKQEQYQSQSDEVYEDDARSSTDKDNVHAGLKAFRQARRELQRMKELEIQQRYQAPQDASQDALPPPSQDARPPTREPAPAMRGPLSRQQSQERRPPPISYNRMPSEESRNGNSSRPGSRALSERDRSGSETSSGGRSGSRPARLRNGSVPRDDYYAPMGSPSGPGPNGMPRQGPMALRPQHMPNQPYPNGSASPGRFNRFGEPSPNPNMQPNHYGYEHGQPSPISPMNGGPSPYGQAGPNSQRPFGGHPGNMEQDPSARRMVRNRDMPDLQMPSSASHGAMGQRDGPRGGPAHQNGMAAPPLPPINPRRKTNIMADYVARPDESTLGVHRMPMSPVSADEGRGGHGAFGVGDDEGPAAYRQRLRKAASEANGLNSRARSLRNSPSQPMVPPPMPPNVTGNGMPGGMM